jgi:hypothetical protein
MAIIAASRIVCTEWQEFRARQQAEAKKKKSRQCQDSRSVLMTCVAEGRMHAKLVVAAASQRYLQQRLSSTKVFAAKRLLREAASLVP